MKSSLTRNLSILIALVAISSTPTGARESYDPGFVQVHLAVGASIEEVNTTYGTTTIDQLEPHYLLQIPPGIDEETLLAQMQGNPETFVCAEYAFRDETPEGVRQMVVTAIGGTIEGYLDQDLVERLHLPDVHPYSTGEGVLIAVLDTGVLAEHEALSGAIAPGGYDFIENDEDPTDTANGLDDDEDGLIDEGAGHGTMVAGIVHLVAPGARILPVRVLDDEGRGTTFTLAKGIRYAVEQGAQIINMSLGLTDRSGIVAHELAQARLESAVMVAAAGNLASDESILYPASDTKVLMVAALDANDVKAKFSSFHSRVALSAPGVGIYAPYFDGGYAIGAGTSFATPFIAGQAALIQSLEPEMNWGGVCDHITLGVASIYEIPANDPFLGKLGTGRIDAWQTFLVTTSFSSVVPAAEQRSLRVAPTVLAFAGTAQVRWDTMSTAPANVLRTFDAAGRLVQSIALASAADGCPWEARDAAGNPLPSGAYWLQLAHGPETQTARIVVVP